MWAVHPLAPSSLQLWAPSEEHLRSCWTHLSSHIVLSLLCLFLPHPLQQPKDHRQTRDSWSTSEEPARGGACGRLPEPRAGETPAKANRCWVGAQTPVRPSVPLPEPLPLLVKGAVSFC